MKNMSQCQFAHHKSHMDWIEMKPGRQVMTPCRHIQTSYSLASRVCKHLSFNASLSQCSSTRIRVPAFPLRMRVRNAPNLVYVTHITLCFWLVKYGAVLAGLSDLCMRCQGQWICFVHQSAVTTAVQVTRSSYRRQKYSWQKLTICLHGKHSNAKNCIPLYDTLSCNEKKSNFNQVPC